MKPIQYNIIVLVLVTTCCGIQLNAAYGQTTGLLLPATSLSASAGNTTSVTLIDPHLARDAILKRALPRHGELQAMRKVLVDPLQRSRATGYLAENSFVQDHPGWKLVTKPNAPQNDVYRWINGRLEGGQIKAFSSGDPKRYYRAMLKDHRAGQFLVPDDHVAALRQSISEHIAQMEQRGQFAKAEELRGQLKRVQPLDRTYGELQQAIKDVPKSWIRRAAVKTGIATGAIVFVVDGGTVIYQSCQGQLTPDETERKLVEAGGKAVAVGTATTLAVIAGANPVGITVFVVAGVTYIVVDYTLDQFDAHYASTPMTVRELVVFMPKANKK